ncbi:MAG: ATP-binding protein [Acidimicrobiia bacterium]|jgi:serine/threonine-protein kinase RsbW
MTVPETADETPRAAPRGVELRIPADAAYLRLARLAAADTAARVGLGADAIDDVRLAVSELCALMTGSRTGIILRFEGDDGCVVVEGRGAPGPGIEGENGELARVLVEAVVDELRFEAVDGHATFRFTKQVEV